MANTIAQKLRIKQGMSILAIHAPEDFIAQLQPLPDEVVISPKAKNYGQVHWFVTNRAQLDKEVDGIIKLIKEDIICWTYYPKGTSKIQTDLTRDKGWDKLVNHEEMQWISLIAFDETWSAFGFRLKTDADKKKEAQPKVREIFNYVDPVKKTVRLPEDLATAFRQNKKAHDIFQTLSFSNKKEYVEWIITAKRDETRISRIAGTIERLLKGWKNPNNT